jgi:hypothetical protein
MKNLPLNTFGKTKAHLAILSGVLFLGLSLCVAFAQTAGGGRNVGLASPSPTPALVDPQTGLPIVPPPPPAWKDENWIDPVIVLTNVAFDGLPISEVARNIRQQFKTNFDILLPDDGRLSDIFVKLEMKNVTASELFNAMNLLFENNRTSLRWELKLSGNRPIALLRLLEDPSTRPNDKPKIKRVYYVGDLIGDESMSDIINTIQQVWGVAYGDQTTIQFYDKAQLLIVTGTDEQINFMQQTLQALRMKTESERAQRAQREMKSNGGGSSK